MYLAFNNSYLIQILLKSNFLYNCENLLKIYFKKYVISKLSQNEPSRPYVMQQSTKNSQTMYLVFNNSYLIQIMLKLIF